MKIPDFGRCYFRFYLDFQRHQAGSISNRSPVRTNRVRVTIESVCRLTHRASGKSTTYALSAPCRTEQVGAGHGELWTQPNAECIFLCSDDGQVAVHKCWHRVDPGVMLYPSSLGPQPERQCFAAGENFQETSLELRSIDATPLVGFQEVADAVLGANPIVSRIDYSDGEYDVRIDQPVKTINLAERDRLHQTDTGPIILPDLSADRLEQSKLGIDLFDLAYSAWHAPDWAEFVIRSPLRLADGISVNHFAKTRHIGSTHNTLFVLDPDSLG